jgi:flagellar export protein FliJ
MKSEKYRLQTVLEIRRRSCDEAAKMIALRLRQLEQEEIALRRRQNELKDCVEKLNQTNFLMNYELEKGLQTHNILQHRNFVEDLRKLEIKLKAEVEKQSQLVCKAEKDLEVAREKLFESTRELKTIENHKTNGQESEHSKKKRREQKITDEIGAILHERGKSSS